MPLFEYGEMPVVHLLLGFVIVAEFLGIGGHVYSSLRDNVDTEHFKKRYSKIPFLSQIAILPLMIIVWTSY
jgi:hypothetical protein